MRRDLTHYAKCKDSFINEQLIRVLNRSIGTQATVSPIPFELVVSPDPS